MSISLGNLEVIAGLPQVKFGATIDDMVGEIDANGKLLTPTSTFNLNFAGVDNVAENGLRYKYAFLNVNAVSFPDLTQVTGFRALNYTFYATTLSSISFPKLTSVSANYAMSYCLSSITTPFTVDLSKLVSITASYGLDYFCQNATGLISLDLSSLETVSGSAAMRSCFYGCTGITTFTFPKLKTLTSSNALNQCFRLCTNLQTLYFPALTSTSFGSANTNQFGNMVQGVTGCTVHFPSNLQSVIGSWSDVTAGFGGTNTTILYDLTATT